MGVLRYCRRSKDEIIQPQSQGEMRIGLSMRWPLPIHALYSIVSIEKSFLSKRYIAALRHPLNAPMLSGLSHGNRSESPECRKKERQWHIGLSFSLSAESTPCKHTWGKTMPSDMEELWSSTPKWPHSSQLLLREIKHHCFQRLPLYKRSGLHVLPPIDSIRMS